MNNKVKGYAVNGVQFTQDSDALGRDNLLTGSGASPSQRWRGNATLGWSDDVHNVNLRANDISGMLDNRLTPFGLIVNNPGARPDVARGYARAPKDSLMFDLLDKDPMSYQGSLGYYPGVGDPRGRIFELAATKKF